MQLIKSSLLLGALAVTSSVADVVQFNIVNADLAPDGFTRSLTTVNGIYPGTLITANKGDVIQVNVSNQLTDPSMRMSTSIHWHGLFQNANAMNDGPAFVTQCPIAPNTSYTYNIPTGDQSGTFWYHSHLSTQYADGLRGPLVIYPEDPQKRLYDVDDETTVITLSDYFHTSARTLSQIAHTKGGAEPVPDSGLINGKGRYNGGPLSDWAVVDVTSSQRYRFRVINMSAGAAFNFSIEGHRLTVIEADGIATQSQLVDNFIIYPAQRYSIVVIANQPVANYWIRAPVTAGVVGTNATYNASNIFGVLRYAGAPIAEPITAPGVASGVALAQNTALHPLSTTGAPGGSGPADTSISLVITRGTDPVTGATAWSFNGTSYQAPTVPALLEILSSGYDSNSNFSASERTLVLQPNKTIEVTITGGGHPIHLHGHVFDIISSNGSPRNYINPVRRDVADATGGLVFRFRTDNPGPWFLHCHIDWHLDAGLAVVFAESPDLQKTLITPDAAWQQLCPIYNALDPAFQ